MTFYQKAALRAFRRALKTGAPFTVPNDHYHKAMRQLERVGRMRMVRRIGRHYYWSESR